MEDQFKPGDIVRRKSSDLSRPMMVYRELPDNQYFCRYYKIYSLVSEIEDGALLVKVDPIPDEFAFEIGDWVQFRDPAARQYSSPTQVVRVNPDNFTFNLRTHDGGMSYDFEKLDFEKTAPSTH